MVIKIWRGTNVWEGAGTNLPHSLSETVYTDGETGVTAHGTRYRFPRFAISQFHLRLPAFGDHAALLWAIADPSSPATLAVHGATYSVVKAQPSRHRRTPIGDEIEVWLGEYREADPYGAIATGVQGGGYIFSAGSCAATLSRLVVEEEEIYYSDGPLYRDDSGLVYTHYANATVVNRRYDFPYLSDDEVNGLLAVIKAGQRLGGNLQLNGTSYFIADDSITFTRETMYWHVRFTLSREENELSEGAAL